MNNLKLSKKFLLLASIEKIVLFYKLTFLFNILKTKPLTLTFKETNGTLVIKTVRKLFKVYLKHIAWLYYWCNFASESQR